MPESARKTRAKREAELQQLWTETGGRAKVIELFLQATGSPTGTIPNSSKQIFKVILDKEYPLG
jgi:hypothetical protein